MNTRTKQILCCTSLCTLLAAAVAQTAGDQPSTTGTAGSPSGAQTGMQPAGQTQQFFHAKNLIGQEAKNTQDQKLGKIEDVVFNPQTGEIFAAVGAGRDRYALVPWQAMTVATGKHGKEEVTLNTTKQALDSGPILSADQWQKLNEPTFVQSIYSHYNLQPPGAMGGAGSPTGGTSSGAGAGATGTGPGTTGQP